MDKADKEYVREKLEKALGFSLEMYGVREMARDSGLNPKEVEWAANHVYFVAKIVEDE